jgi:hypothetical protein
MIIAESARSAEWRHGMAFVRTIALSELVGREVVDGNDEEIEN